MNPLRLFVPIPTFLNGLKVFFGEKTSTKATKNTKGFSTPKTVDLMPLGGLKHQKIGGWNVLGMSVGSLNPGVFLVGGLKYFLFSPLFGEDFQFD